MRSPSDSVTVAHVRRGTTCPLTASATLSGLTPRRSRSVGTSTASASKSHGCWLMMSCIGLPPRDSRLMGRSIEGAPQPGGSVIRVWAGQDRRDDGHATATCGEDLVEVVGSDAADGEHRDLHGLDDGSELDETPRRYARMCRGRKYRSEEHTSELQSHSFISYAVFCLKKNIHHIHSHRRFPTPATSTRQLLQYVL